MYHVSSLCTIQTCCTTFVSSWSLPWWNWTFTLKVFKDAWACKDIALHRLLEQSSSSLAVHRLHRDYSPCRSTRFAFRGYGKSGEDFRIVALLTARCNLDETKILYCGQLTRKHVVWSDNSVVAICFHKTEEVRHLHWIYCNGWRMSNAMTLTLMRGLQ